MFKGTLASGSALTANTNIPFVPVLNTNCKTIYNSSDNSVSILKQGYYDVYVSLPLSNVSATPITLQLYANGNPISEAVSVVGIVATTGVNTVQLYDCIRVTSSVSTNIANISVRITGATATTDAVGVFIIEERK